MSFYTFQDIAITGLASAVPGNSLKTESFGSKFGNEAVDAFRLKTGIESLHISADEQTASDLGFDAAVSLLDKKQLDLADIGCIIFVSRTPDYRSPATAAVLHKRLKLSVDCVAYDINMGGAGFVYGLQMSCSILDEINKSYALLIIGDTNSKQISDENQLSMSMGDGASAILLEKKHSAAPIYINTQANGNGYDAFIHSEGGFRIPSDKEYTQDAIHANKAVIDTLEINETAMNSFIVNEIPSTITKFVSKLNTTLKQFDFVSLQQENEFLLKQIAEKLNIPFEELPVNYQNFGNTSGNSIPLLLVDKLANQENREVKVLACGFGEGFSSGVTAFTINTSDILPLLKTDNFYQEGVVSHIF